MFIPKDKSEIFTDASEYEALIKTGVGIFNENIPFFLKSVRTLDVIVALTSKGNIYSAVVHYDRANEDNPTLLQMKENDDTEIVKYIAMYAMGGYDFGPSDFRKKLIELNPKNLEAEMLLTTECGFVKRKVKQIQVQRNETDC